MLCKCFFLYINIISLGHKTLIKKIGVGDANFRYTGMTYNIKNLKCITYDCTGLTISCPQKCNLQHNYIFVQCVVDAIVIYQTNVYLSAQFVSTVPANVEIFQCTYFYV